MKWIKTILLLQAVVIVLSLTGFAYLYNKIETERPSTSNAIPTPSREQVNGAVARLILAGRSTELYSFYAQEVGDPTRSMLYVAAALIRGAPVDLIVSVGWWEGGHQINKIGPRNENGSVDVYPMSLNSFTYKAYSIDELKRVEFNISEGVYHLCNNREKFNCSWESAMAAYNHGTVVGLDQRQVDYVAAVLRHEIELDRKFAVRFADAL
jgi:Transglycosylase SLT domain